MSNRPKKSRRPGGPPQPAADRTKTLLIVGGAFVVVVVIGLLLALGGADDSKDSTDATDAPDFGPVAVDGAALPELEGGDDAAIGMTAPRVEGTDPTGSGTSVGGKGNGPTLVGFFAHWCPHCQAEVPVLVTLMTEGELEGVKTVAVLTGTSSDAPNYPPVAWLEREGWTGDVLLDDEKGTAARAYGVAGYPFMVILDADGKVVARTSGEIGRDKLLELLGDVRPET